MRHRIGGGGVKWVSPFSKKKRRKKGGGRRRYGTEMLMVWRGGKRVLENYFEMN